MEQERGIILHSKSQELQKKTLEAILRDSTGKVFIVSTEENITEAEIGILKEHVQLPAHATLIVGHVGHGRTHSLREMIKSGEVIVIDLLRDLQTAVRSSQIPNNEKPAFAESLKNLAPVELPELTENAYNYNRTKTNYIDGKKLPRKKRK